MTGISTSNSTQIKQAKERLSRLNMKPSPLVLIVEDDPDSRLMLRYLLEMWDYRVAEANDGDEAVDFVRQTRPDLILMDVRLPNLDGLGATRRIRSLGEMDGMPIIFLSACAENLYRQQALDAGGNDYLVKPIDFQQLESTIERHIKK